MICTQLGVQAALPLPPPAQNRRPKRLTFIRHAQAAGLTLDAIRRCWTSVTAASGRACTSST